jgi:hypothetical protein
MERTASRWLVATLALAALASAESARAEDSLSVVNHTGGPVVVLVKSTGKTWPQAVRIPIPKDQQTTIALRSPTTFDVAFRTSDNRIIQIEGVDVHKELKLDPGASEDVILDFAQVGRWYGTQYVAAKFPANVRMTMQAVPGVARFELTDDALAAPWGNEGGFGNFGSGNVGSAMPPESAPPSSSAPGISPPRPPVLP